jgi:hypothetical protein
MATLRSTPKRKTIGGASIRLVRVRVTMKENGERRRYSSTIVFTGPVTESLLANNLIKPSVRSST